MKRFPSLAAAAWLAAAAFAFHGPIAPSPAHAQGGQQQQWFVPGQQQQRPPAQTQQRPATQQPQQRPGAPAQGQVAGPPDPGAPRLPPLQRSEPPPPAIIGVVGLPEVFEASVAARGVRQTVQERLARLNEEAQKEQAAWRDAQQQLASQRTSLTPEQLRDRERELQERITNGQRVLRERNAQIQQSGQRALAEVERVALYVIGQVAEARGLNLVLNRGALILAIDELDITRAVVEQLNRALPAVQVEGDAAPAPAAAAAPAARPAGQAPAAQQRPAGQAPPAQQQQQQRRN
jgi:Skp family chaperone for outer membrane proteins